MAQPSTTGKKRSCPRKPERRGGVATSERVPRAPLEPDKSQPPFAPLCRALTSLPHVREASASARPVGGLLAESLEHEAFKGYPLLALRRSLGGRGDEALILVSMRLAACAGAFSTLALLSSVVQTLSRDGLEIGLRPVVSAKSGELLFCIDLFVPQGGAYPHRLEIASTELMSAISQAQQSAPAQRRTISAKRPTKSASRQTKRVAKSA